VTAPALLDASVLIALFDLAHVHHEVAHDWFAGNRARGWATTPLTENALLRIVSNPKYGSNWERTPILATRLRTFCTTADHLFWPDTLSLLDSAVFDLSRASHQQLTYVYLLGLAKTNGGVLATFDRTVPFAAVLGGTREMVDVIAP
jgi:predicted nucleic acid-binding protein